MYSLSFEMMIQVLRQLGSSGEFRAQIPPQGALREGGHVILHVQSGNVILCLIFSKTGKKLYHDEAAQRLLPRLGILDWKLVTPIQDMPPRDANLVPPAVPGTRSVERYSDLIPQRHSRISRMRGSKENPCQHIQRAPCWTQ